MKTPDAARSHHRTFEEMVEIAGARRRRILELEAVVKRLASSEGFEGAGMIDGDSFAECELRARMRYAEEALDADE